MPCCLCFEKKQIRQERLQYFPETSLRILRIEAKQRIAPHYHRASAQSYFGVEGTVEVTVNGVPHRIGPGDAARVPMGAIHGLRPIGGPAIVVSVSIPPLRADDHHPVEQGSAE